MKNRIIAAPAADGSHLNTYGQDRAQRNQAPSMADSLIMVWQNPEEGQWKCGMKFTAGSDDDVVHHYVLALMEDGVEIRSEQIFSEFLFAPQLSMMRGNYGYDLGLLKPGTGYEIHITAVDCWDAASEPAVYAFVTDEAAA